MSKLDDYRQAKKVSNTNRLWPLYGAGFENLGQENRPLAAGVPLSGPDELLVRHYPFGLCFSDIKVIKDGEPHTRLFQGMNKEPGVLGPEWA